MTDDLDAARAIDRAVAMMKVKLFCLPRFRQIHVVAQLAIVVAGD